MARKLMKGSEAMAEAAIRNGCRYFFGYPITPQTEIPEYFSERMFEEEVNGCFLQAESELAAINMVYGAASTGARVLTSSSSPGISLKQEGISTLCAAELPCVIYNVMRSGPGIAGIQASQGDYFQATKGGGHGDYHVIVFAPSSVQEAVDCIGKAFDLADAYRMPAMICADGMIAQMMEPAELPAMQEYHVDKEKKWWAATGFDPKAPEGQRANVSSTYTGVEEMDELQARLQGKYALIQEKEALFETYNMDHARCFYEEVFHFAEKEYGPENIVSAVMHADELNTAVSEQLGYPVYHYHLHVVALPVVEKEIRYSKRCKDPELVGKVKEVIHQISHSKKWASQKAPDEDGKSRIVKSYSLLQDRFFEHMRDAGFEDFERGERGSTAQHLSVTEYKVKKETERLENLQVTAKVMEDGIDLLTQQTEEAQKEADKAQARVVKLVPKMEKIEDLARKYTSDADQVLPQPDVLESAKSYREKKAMPLYRKIISVLRNLFDKYLTLKHDYEDLQRKYEREIDSGEQLKKTIKTLREEKDSQSGIVAKFYALCRGLGKEYIESQAMGILEREAQERQQKKLAHKRHERDAR